MAPTSNDTPGQDRRRNHSLDSVSEESRARAFADPARLCDLAVRVVQDLRAAGVDLVILLDFILWGSDTSISNQILQQARYRFTHYSNLPSILDRLARPPAGRNGQRPEGASQALHSWAIQYVESIIMKDMAKIGALLDSSNEDVSRESLMSIKFDSLMDSMKKDTPDLWRLMRKAAYTEKQDARNSKKTPDRVITQILSMAAYSSSQRHNKIAKLNAISMRAAGVPVRTMDALHAMGITMSYSWTCDCINSLTDAERGAFQATMQQIPEVPHTCLFRWDNFNFGSKVFEYRILHQKHFRSGTAITAQILPPAARVLANRATLMEGRKKGASTRFDVHKALFDEARQDSTDAFYRHHVLSILLEHPDMEGYKYRADPTLASPPPVQQLEGGAEAVRRTFMLGAYPIDEATLAGNAEVIQKIMDLAGLSEGEPLKWFAESGVMLVGGDLLTIDRFLSLYMLRADDINGAERLDAFLPTFGWLHAMFALVESMHTQYKGTAAGLGINHAAVVLKRKKLANLDKRGPWYRIVEAGLLDMLEAHIIGAYLVVGDASSIVELKKLSPGELKVLADEVYKRFASTTALRMKDGADEVLKASIMFIRDTLVLRELVTAIRVGDVGRMHNLIPTLLARFHGGANKNYANHFFELVQCLSVDWDADICDLVMKYGWLLTTDGKNWLPVDEDQEHMIRLIKGFAQSHGPEDPMDFIEKIAPAIPTLRAVLDHYHDTIGGSNRGAKHTSPDREDDIAKLCKAYRQARVHLYEPGRSVTHQDDLPKDIVANGWKLIVEGVSIDQWFTTRAASMPRSDAQTFITSIDRKSNNTNGSKDTQGDGKGSEEGGGTERQEGTIISGGEESDPSDYDDLYLD